MDLQFRKESIPYLHKVLDQSQSQEFTQEVRLPEGMPDIGRVIASWAQVLIRGKEWRSGNVGINGGAMVWTLYAPEDGSGYQCVETWIPMQLKWDIPEGTQDGRICAVPILLSVDARSIATRKIMVRAAINIVVKAWVNDRKEIGVPEELPEDVCILKNTYPMMLPAAAGEKQFSLEETLELSANMAAPDKILYCKLCPVVTEQKIMADKLIFRGDCVLHLLYLGNDGQLYRWNGNVPFSQYAELDRDCSDHAEPVIELAVTNLDLEKNTEGKLHLKAGILGQFMICDRENVSIVEDVYSPRRQIAIQTESVTLPSLLDAVEETVKAQISTEDMGDVVADVQFYPDIPQMYRDRDGVHCELTGVFSVLDRDMEGNFQNLVRSWSENKTLQADDNVKLDIQMKPALVGVRGDIMEADIPVTIRYWAETALPMVTEVEMGEPQDPDPNRPTLVLRRKGEQSLWELAKETGSTVERIQDANGLVGEPDSAKMLLIPVL